MSTDTPSDSQRQTSEEASNSSKYTMSSGWTATAALAMLLAFVVVISALHCFDGTEPHAPPKPTPEPSIEPNEPGGGNGSDPADTTKTVQKKPSVAPSLLAVRKSQLGRMQSRLRQVRLKWDNLNTAATEWHGELRKRLAGDDGRKLAADRYLVERYMAIHDLKRLSQEGIDDLGKRLDGFDEDFDSIAATIEETEWEVDEDSVLDELTKVEKEIVAALESYVDHLLMVKVLLGQADGLEPDRLSLAEVIGQIVAEKEKKQIDEVQKAREDAEDAMTATLAANAKRRKELDDEIARIKDQIETDQREADAAETAGQAEHAKAQREEADRKAELARQFEQQFPAIESYLTPFTSPGYTQPTGRTYKRTTTKGAVSYKSLVGAGVLGDDKKSVERFYYSTVAGNNDRELGAFPPHSYSSGHFERHYETILKVQSFLRKFGPVLVKENKLAP